MTPFGAWARVAYPRVPYFLSASCGRVTGMGFIRQSLPLFVEMQTMQPGLIWSPSGAFPVFRSYVSVTRHKWPLASRIMEGRWLAASEGKGEGTLCDQVAPQSV